ncbi:MAG: RDD family protein [Methylococcales bacterium]|nr:RDD family protein [Methylococcales bacterium]
MTNIRIPHTTTSTPTPTHTLRHRPAKTDPSLYLWQRCFARGVDYAICGLLIIIALPALMMKPLVLIFFITLLWVIIEPVCLLICGTTVGKALFGLRLISHNTKPKYLWRSIAVWIVGLGCGIPVIFLLTALKAAMTLQQKGETYWDNRFGFQVIAESVSIVRTMLLTITVVLIFAGSGIWKKASYLQEIQVEHIAATTPPPQTDGCTGNCRNGFGTYVYVDGSKYDGYWRNGEHAIYDPDSEKRLAEQKAAQDALEEQQKVAQAALEAQQKTAQAALELPQKAALDAQGLTTAPQDDLARARVKAEAQRQAEYDRIRIQVSADNASNVRNAKDAARVAEEAAEEARQSVFDNDRSRDQEIQRANTLEKEASIARADANEKIRLAPFSQVYVPVQELEDKTRMAEQEAEKAKLSVSNNNLSRDKEIQRANALTAAANRARSDANEKTRLAAAHLTDAQIDELGKEHIRQAREAHEEHIRELYRTMPVDTFSTYGMAK